MPVARFDLPLLYDPMTARTYHECYGDPKPNRNTPTVNGELTVPVADCIIHHVGSEADTVAHDYAVKVAGGEHHDAYRINIGNFLCRP